MLLACLLVCIFLVSYRLAVSLEWKSKIHIGYLQSVGKTAATVLMRVKDAEFPAEVGFQRIGSDDFHVISRLETSSDADFLFQIMKPAQSNRFCGKLIVKSMAFTKEFPVSLDKIDWDPGSNGGSSKKLHNDVRFDSLKSGAVSIGEFTFRSGNPRKTIGLELLIRKAL